ncbi:MAG: TIGR03619 family F420-dependent LLM class oxidoreductase [bacterium]|nr:TIGR03619 family F420-dependent LLM class oxidoreductase [bacterium]
MRLGVYVRNMGPQSAPDTVVACARAVEDLGLAHLWVGDHIAIPPDDAEGSDGRYLDPLATLAFLAGCTTRIELGMGVLVLPYRPALPTAKWVATIQELSRGRLLLGVGVGWMQPEFRATGADFRRRGRVSDETLEFFRRCFAGDVVEANGQPFLFRPRPPRPPILVGGGPGPAFPRVLRFGDGWMPFAAEPDDLAPQIAELRRQCAAAGRPAPRIVAVTRLDLADRPAATARAQAFAAAGVTDLVHGWRYAGYDDFRTAAEALAALAPHG